MSAAHNNRFPIWCQICQKKHWDPKVDPTIRRLKVVLGSSTLAHLWKTEGYQNGFHIGKYTKGEIISKSI